MLHGTELPTREPCISRVPTPACGQNTLYSTGTDKLDLDVSSSAVCNPNHDRDMLQLLEVMRFERFLCHSHLARNTISRNRLTTTCRLEQVHSTVPDLYRRELDPGLRLHRLPIHSCIDKTLATKSTVAVLVAVWSTSRGRFPVRIVWVHFHAGAYAKMLQIAPIQLRPTEGSVRPDDIEWLGHIPGLEGECKYACSIWRGSRSSSVTMRTFVLANIRGHLQNREICERAFEDT